MGGANLVAADVILERRGGVLALARRAEVHQAANRCHVLLAFGDIRQGDDEKTRGKRRARGFGEVCVRLAAEWDEVRCGLTRRALGEVDLAVASELDDEVQRVEAACRRVALQVKDDPMVPEPAGGVASELKQLVFAGDDKVPRCRHARV